MTAPTQSEEILLKLKTQLHRLIIENRDETGAIDASDQSAMADEIIQLVRTTFEDCLPEEAPFECPNVSGGGNCNQKDCQACSSWMRHSSEGSGGFNLAIATTRTAFERKVGKG